MKPDGYIIFQSLAIYIIENLATFGHTGFRCRVILVLILDHEAAHVFDDFFQNIFRVELILQVVPALG